MVELVVVENCFHVLRVELMERTRVKIVECYEVLTLWHHLVQLANQTAHQKILANVTYSSRQGRAAYSITPGALTRCKKVAAYF